MSFPGVKVEVSNGGLQREIAVLDGVCALVATVEQSANIGVVNQIYNLSDAEEKGYTAIAEPFIHGLLKEYYNELGGAQRLFVMGTAETMTMTQALTPTESEGVLKLLNASAGAVNLLAIARKPSSGYNAGAGFLDSDVAAAVTASKSLCEALQRKNTPIRVFIEGRVANEAVANTYKPNTANNGFVGVILGGTSTDGSAAVSLALARACKYPAHVKLGSGQNGALSVQDIFLGTKRIESVLSIETLHDDGFLTFHNRPGASGYYFGRDNMATNDDYRILVHGRVIDKAQRIAAQAYTPYIEDSIRINPNGTINETDAMSLEQTLKSAILSNMGGQISDVDVSVNPNQDVINTSSISVVAKVLPLGYLTWINVELGLTTSIS